MTPEELLKPRYRVITDYPGCSYLVGEILEPDEEGELYSKTAGYSWKITRIMEKDVHKYPLLVQKINWWEDRKPEDMPKYVKFVKNYLVWKAGQVFKYSDWNLEQPGSNESIGFITGEGEYDKAAVPPHHLQIVPATAEEYQQYLSSLNK